MATPCTTASFHVQGASVADCEEGKRLLIRAREKPLAAFVFTPALAAEIANDLLQPRARAVATQLKHKRTEDPR